MEHDQDGSFTGTGTVDSWMVIKLLLLAGCAWLIWKYFSRKGRYNYPPGPVNFPVVGCAPLLDHKTPIKTFTAWAKKYGRVFYCKLGKDEILVINDYGLLKTLFSNDTCQNRPGNGGSYQRKIESGGHCGLIFASGQSWKEHRRFVLRSLKDLGVGRRSIEDKVTEEAEYLAKTFLATNGRPFDDKLAISTAVANVIANESLKMLAEQLHSSIQLTEKSSDQLLKIATKKTKIVWDERYEVEDTTFQGLLDAVTTLFRTSFASAMLNSYLWLRFFPPFRGVFKMYDRCGRRISSYFSQRTKEHIETWQPKNDRDMMDAYISSLKQGEFSTFDEKYQLPYLAEDLMQAGFETTSTALRWAFLLMCVHPDVQRKVQAELDANISDGSSARPSDKLDLPYTEAVLAEVQRFSSFIPFGVMHGTDFDSVNIDGYTVPANTWILPNVYFIHHDERLWEEPDEFRPERFLSSSGKFSEPEYYIPFSIGRRKCPGENLARIELLTLFTKVLKDLTLSLPAGAIVNLEPVAGVTLDTQPHSIVALPRGR